MRSSKVSMPQRTALWCYAAVLLWAPFPLGSNRLWSSSFLIGMIAVCWLLWGAGTWQGPARGFTPLRLFPIPIFLGAITLLWVVIQILPWAPATWTNSIWVIASDTMGRPLTATISISPSHTAIEGLKLLSYAMAAWLSFLISRRSRRAAFLLDMLLIAGSLYAAYAVAIKLLSIGQFQLFYSSTPVVDRYLSGPFVLHNSYATYAGLIAILAFVRLVAMGRRHAVTSRGFQPWLLSGLNYLFGSGVWLFTAFVLSFSTLIASASRAGVLAAICGMTAALIMLTLMAARKTQAKSVWPMLIAFLFVSVLIAVTGGTLVSRLSDFANAGGIDAFRYPVWDATLRMIKDAPLLGSGLGSFEAAYPLYAGHVFPWVIDKAHNDYLEFAAGLGLPAAASWWIAWLWLTILTARGAFIRRRNSHFAVMAFAASVLVAVHSAFDFSLQIPAVSLTYATILGMGLAQSFPSSVMRGHKRHRSEQYRPLPDNSQSELQ